MKHRFGLHLVFCLTVGAALGLASSADAQTCMGFTCTIVGTSGADTLNGTSGGDVICGLGGNDTINGAGGNDKICGGSGADNLHGNQGNDLIDGENDGDTIDGDEDTDTAVFSFAITADLSTSSTSNFDTLVDIENLTGSSSGDTLIGNGSANVLIGHGGNDRLVGNGGADTLDGDNGSDTAAYGTAITASLATGTASDGDSLTEIENLEGSGGNDVLTGDSGNNVLDGLAGVDSLDGGAGTDTCNGGLPIGRPEIPDPDTCTNCETVTGCSVP